MKIKLAILLAISFCFIKYSKAQLKIDSTFGKNGYFISSPSNFSSSDKLLIDDNGDLIEAGAVYTNGNLWRLRLWKFNKNGDSIKSFANNGIALNTSLDNVSGNLLIVNLLKSTDDKLWLCFQLEIPSTVKFDSNKYQIGIARFNTNGSPDVSFGTNGYILNRPQASFEFHPTAMVLENSLDGTSAYVSSWVSETGHASCPAGFGKWCISKYGSNGALANSFNGIGYKQLSSDSILQDVALSPLAIIKDLALDANGNVLACGALHNYDRSYFNFKLKPDGNWVNNFGNNGRNLIPVNYDLPVNRITGSKILKDLSIVYYTNYNYYSGSSNFKDSVPIVMIKSDINGKRDSSFGTLGTAFAYFLDVNHYPLYSYLNDGSCLIANYCKKGAMFANQQIEFIYLKPNGMQDLSFGNNGRLIAAIRVPDTHVNGTILSDICLDKTETEIYLASSHQLPSTTSYSYGAIKFKWTSKFPFSLTKESEPKSFEIYPNPIFNNLINVKHNAMLDRLTVLNIMGQTIPYEVVNKSNSAIQIRCLKNLIPGKYYISLQSNLGTVVKQFMVQ